MMAAIESYEDESAKRRWNKANIGLINHRNYILNKSTKYPLTLIDLLYISNFKGGNGTISEDETQIVIKLKYYSDLFQKIEEEFGSKDLFSLDERGVASLSKHLKLIFNMVSTTKYHIDGFGISRFSA